MPEITCDCGEALTYEEKTSGGLLGSMPPLTVDLTCERCQAWWGVMVSSGEKWRKHRRAAGD